MSRKPAAPASPATRTAAVVGLGYVGLPLLVELAESGYHAIGIDLDPSKVGAVRGGRSYIPDVAEERVAKLRAAGRIDAATRFERLAEADAVSICVPTPLGKSREPDLSYIISAVDSIRPHLRAGAVVVLESTTYPGTTEELVLPKLSDGGREAGRDFFLAFSPERVDPGNKRFHTRNTPKVLGGVTPACTEAAREYYAPVFDQLVLVSSPRAAEMVKLLENTFRAVNIGLVNEVAIMCERLGLDVWEVIGAAATKPFGFMPFQPGPGLGGHCIPVDPLYLSWKLRTLNYTARFIDLASEVNTGMPSYVVQRLVLALNERRKPVKGAKVLLLGVSYKRDVGDVRESPALDIIEQLQRLGAKVSFHDPFVPRLAEGHLDLASRPLTDAALKGSDAVVVVADHSAIDYARVARLAPYVFDTRNATRGLKRANIERL
ncbi:MAG: nucleotide sugar dehydrogenase [Candidatus Sumerlaeia bacterium]|nr:nucleotide sugar dehydrogenase [Candidatus Sumerlaeia bacterium]